jgi:hypothetical protein
VEHDTGLGLSVHRLRRCAGRRGSCAD